MPSASIMPGPGTDHRFRAGIVAVCFSLTLLLGFAQFGPAAAHKTDKSSSSGKASSAQSTPAPHVDIQPLPEGPLPRVLTPKDAAHYRAIFELQKDGDWRQADRHIRAIENDILMGHVLAQRYMHPTKYRSRYSELREWMVKYADHPDADRIYKLARKRKPKKAKALPMPRLRGTKAAQVEADQRRQTRRKLSQRELQVARVNARIRSQVRRGRPDLAERILKQRGTVKHLNRVEFDSARTRVANGYFIKGKDEKALKLAAASGRRSGSKISMAHWIAGLASYRLGRLDQAAKQFEEHALSPAAEDWNISAGAYWAARVHLINRDPKKVSQWLKIAAQHPHTFYGLLAVRALGQDLKIDWSFPVLTKGDINYLMTKPPGKRVVALVEVGDYVQAERELKTHFYTPDPVAARSVLVLADHATLPNLTLRTARIIRDRGGETIFAGLYPVPPWKPKNGFEIDRALVYAFMRQESGFNSRARSSAGARGLMQLMPATASYMANGKRRFRGSRRAHLYDPELNLSLGERYIKYLLGQERIDGNLFLLAAAYNGGIGNMAKWERRMKTIDDPLLYIESIPSRETRIFIERVLANLWLYRLRLGQPTPSLDEVVAGRWPTYIGLDRSDVSIADHGKD